MTTAQFRAAHLLPTRGSQRRGPGNAWTVQGGWGANNLVTGAGAVTPAEGEWRNDPLPYTLGRVDKDLSTVDHFAVDSLSAHHHERQKRLAIYSKAADHAFSERAARWPAAIPLHPPDNLAYETESQVQASVLDGRHHPADGRKGALDTHWMDGLARDGRGVAGGFAANQHPDVRTTQHCHQDEVARQKAAQRQKDRLITRGRAWIDQLEPPPHVKKDDEEMFMKMPSSRQPRARNDLMPGYRDLQGDLQMHVNAAGSLGWDFKNDMWATGPPRPFCHPPPPYGITRQSRLPARERSVRQKCNGGVQKGVRWEEPREGEVVVEEQGGAGDVKEYDERGQHTEAAPTPDSAAQGADFIFNLVILGDAAVGKTSMLESMAAGAPARGHVTRVTDRLRYASISFQAGSSPPAQWAGCSSMQTARALDGGVDMCHPLPDPHTVQVRVWELSMGSGQGEAALEDYYRVLATADGVLLLYNIMLRSTIDSCEGVWYRLLQTAAAAARAGASRREVAVQRDDAPPPPSARFFGLAPFAEQFQEKRGSAHHRRLTLDSHSGKSAPQPLPADGLVPPGTFTPIRKRGEFKDARIGSGVAKPSVMSAARAAAPRPGDMQERHDAGGHGPAADSALPRRATPQAEEHAAPAEDGAELPALREPLLLLVGTHADRAGVAGRLPARNGSLQMRRAVPMEEGKAVAKQLSSAFIEVSSADAESAFAALDILASELYWRAIERESRAAGLKARCPRRPCGSDVHPTALLWHEHAKIRPLVSAKHRG